jgi:acetyl esterase
MGNADLLDADSSRLALAGDSAGGCLATVVAGMAAQRYGHALRMQALLYPCLDTRTDRQSMQADRDPMLRAETMQYFWNTYLEGCLTSTDALAVPMRRDSLAGLPPAFLAVGEFDPLLDETEEYARRLRQDGVATEFRRVEGCIHGFYRARFVSDMARVEFDHLCLALRRALAI